MPVEFIKNIEFQYPNEEKLRAWIKDTISEEGYFCGNITYVFMSDEALLEYNKQYLNHDFYTDIITFDDVVNKEINSDILVSIDRIIDNAKTLKTPLIQEFSRVIIHGILHLCGYKDKSSADEQTMRSKEEYYLKKLNLN